MDLMILLNERCFSIDYELLIAHNKNKTDLATLNFKNKWNFVLDVVKQQGNKNLRLGIITNEIKPEKLVYAE